MSPACIRFHAAGRHDDDVSLRRNFFEDAAHGFFNGDVRVGKCGIKTRLHSLVIDLRRQPFRIQKPVAGDVTELMVIQIRSNGSRRITSATASRPDAENQSPPCAFGRDRRSTDDLHLFDA